MRQQQLSSCTGVQLHATKSPQSLQSILSEYVPQKINRSSRMMLIFYYLLMANSFAHSLEESPDIAGGHIYRGRWSGRVPWREVRCVAIKWRNPHRFNRWATPKAVKTVATSLDMRGVYPRGARQFQAHTTFVAAQRKHYPPFQPFPVE